MWLQANLHPKLLLLGEGRGAGRHFQLGSSSAPGLLTDPFPNQDTTSWMQHPKLRVRQGMEACSEPLSLTYTSSPPPIIHPLIVMMRPLGCLSTEPLESHICITQTSDRKLGCHSLWAIVPALVGNPWAASAHNGQLQLLQTRGCPVLQLLCLYGSTSLQIP